ncbi:capping protein inhibiting regulator of actin dynamics isoform X2 [Cyprinodon tularosa]|nr:capping protein inhibiting regulator of actin dynamics isoform X2 [Cyprinodon tularosa]
MSQENVSDKVRNLQRQIAQGIKFGQRPLSLRKSEEGEGSSDEEEVPRSPLKVLVQVETEPPKMEPKVQGAQSFGQHSPPVKSPRSKRVLPPMGIIESINLDAVPQSVPRLDNTAAKHKLSIKPKNQRISRKHRRFTLDLQEVSVPGDIQEDLEAGGVFLDDQRRASLESSKESLKKQRLYEEDILEARSRREMEEQRLREEAEQRKMRAEELRLRELEEERRQQEQERRMREETERREKEEEELRRVREEDEKLRREEAERQRKEEEARRMEEEEERRRQEEAERQRKEEEARRMEEEQERRRQEEAERQRKEEARRMEEEQERRRQEEAERQRKEEEASRMEEEQERRRQEEAEKIKREEEERKMHEEAERMRIEEEKRKVREEERRKEEKQQIKKLEEERKKQKVQHQQQVDRRQLEEQKQREEEERKRLEEEERRKREEEVAKGQQELEAEKRKKQKEEEEERKKKEEQKLRLREMEHKKLLELEEQKNILTEEAAASYDEQVRKRRAEEQRWREMEERQRPFTFKVSSGEKQILFQKVNLTPVTPASSHQSTADADQREGAVASLLEGQDPPNLPASPYVPHTAILVTGAQLCGTAVNLDQIKDPACMSLLGLGEERKAQGTPSAKSKSSPDRKSVKSKSLSESSFSTDQSSSAVLAEWASIRSKIFKGVEEGKYDEYPDPPSRLQLGSEEQAPFSHTNLRKTMSASAKFSITPAKKKFGSNRNSEVLSADKVGEEEKVPSDSPTAATWSPSGKPQSLTSKTVWAVERGSEECMFAKDLPSFLVPSPGDRPEGSDVKSRLQCKTEEDEAKAQDGEDNPSPFGIKLRRTNYSLRFHSEQSTEKRKKRYSAGDSFDGVPSPLTPIEPDSDASSVFSDKSSPTSPQKEGLVSKFLHTSASPATTCGKPGKPTSPTAHNEREKALFKPPLYRRPATSPKPSGSTPTPPPSPLPKVPHRFPCEDVIQRTGSPDSSVQEQTDRSEEPVAQLHRGSYIHVQGEEEPKEKRSFFPSINIPWREKSDRKAELIRREKPSLQARHSLDSAKVQEKEAGPLWITLALQKQKGFREQQQTREERRSQREAKLAEKQARERHGIGLVSPTGGKESWGTSPSFKPQIPGEPKRPDSLLGRLERRDPLKKASTLPSSVTVEISDSTPSPPAVKDVSKRFPSSDSPQVSTEPAWLALAKRKAKAWSDCPQIIK